MNIKPTLENIEASILRPAVLLRNSISASIDLSEFSFEEAIIILQTSAPWTAANSSHYCLYVHPNNQFIAYKIAEKYSKMLYKKITVKLINRFIDEIDWFISMGGVDPFPITNNPSPLSESSNFICGSYLNLNKKTNLYIH